MLNISGTDVKLWVDEHDGKNGKFNTYSISISKKDQEGKYHNKPVKVSFSREVNVPSNVANGDTITFEGFPTVDFYDGKDGKEVRNVAIVITQAEFSTFVEKDVMDSFTEAEEDIPFGG